MKAKIFFLTLLLSCITIVNSQTSDSLINEKDVFIKAHDMAANKFNDSLLMEYINAYPEGEFTEKAEMSIDVCAWQNARFKNTVESYELYLEKFPDGRAADYANQKLLSLKDTTESNE